MSRKWFLISMLVVLLASLSLSAVAAQDEVTIRWRTRPDNQAEIDVYTALSAQIDEAMDGITLVYEPGGTETAGYQDTLLTEFAANNAPDIYWIPGADLARFVTEGAVLNLVDLAAADANFDASVFYPQEIEQLSYNPESDSYEGALWGLPRDASSMALFFNKDLFDEAGVPYPTERLANGEWDWDTFKADAATISDLGEEIYGFGMNAWWGNWELFINAGGGSYFTEARDACNLNSQENIDTLTFLRSLYEEEIAVPYGTDSEPPFLAGNVGMFLNGRWATPNMLSQAGYNWDVAEVPAGPAGQSNFLFWGAYVINPNTANPQAAWDVLQQLTALDTQLQVAALGANFPSRTGQEVLDAVNEAFPQINNGAFLTALANYAVPESPLWKGDFGQINWNTVEPAITEVLTGAVTPEDFAASICGQIEQYFN